jgi:hypothetical protein
MSEVWSETEERKPNAERPSSQRDRREERINTENTKFGHIGHREEVTASDRGVR